MIANISSSNASFEETLNTLKYANRAKNIKTNVQRNVLEVNHHVSEYVSLIQNLRTEVTVLKSQLSHATQGQEVPLQAVVAASSSSPPSHLRFDEAALSSHAQHEAEHREAPAGMQTPSTDKRALKEMKAWMQENFGERMQLRRALIELEDQNVQNSIAIGKRQLVVANWNAARLHTPKKHHDKAASGGGGKKKKKKDEEDEEAAPEEEEEAPEEDVSRLRDLVRTAPSDVQAAYDDIEQLRHAIDTNKATKRATMRRLRENEQAAEQFHEDLRVNRRVTGEDRRELLELMYRTGNLELGNMQLEQAQVIHEAVVKGKDLTIQKLELQLQMRDKVISQQRALLRAHAIDESIGDLGMLLMQDTAMAQNFDTLLRSVTPAPPRMTHFADPGNKINKDDQQQQQPSSSSQQPRRTPPVAAASPGRVVHVRERRSSETEALEPPPPLGASLDDDAVVEDLRINNPMMRMMMRTRPTATEAALLSDRRRAEPRRVDRSERRRDHQHQHRHEEFFGGGAPPEKKNHHHHRGVASDDDEEEEVLGVAGRGLAQQAGGALAPKKGLVGLFAAGGTSAVSFDDFPSAPRGGGQNHHHQQQQQSSSQAELLFDAPPDNNSYHDDDDDSVVGGGKRALLSKNVFSNGGPATARSATPRNDMFVEGGGVGVQKKIARRKPQPQTLAAPPQNGASDRPPRILLGGPHHHHHHHHHHNENGETTHAAAAEALSGESDADNNNNSNNNNNNNNNNSSSAASLAAPRPRRRQRNYTTNNNHPSSNAQRDGHRANARRRPPYAQSMTKNNAGKPPHTTNNHHPPSTTNPTNNHHAQGPLLVDATVARGGVVFFPPHPAVRLPAAQLTDATNQLFGGYKGHTTATTEHSNHHAMGTEPNRRRRNSNSNLHPQGSHSARGCPPSTHHNNVKAGVTARATRRAVDSLADQRIHPADLLLGDAPLTTEPPGRDNETALFHSDEEEDDDDDDDDDDRTVDRLDLEVYGVRQQRPGEQQHHPPPPRFVNNNNNNNSNNPPAVLFPERRPSLGNIRSKLAGRQSTDPHQQRDSLDNLFVGLCSNAVVS